MLRKHHQFIASMLWLLDITVVLAAFALAYYTRFFQHELIPARHGVSPVAETQALVFSIIVIWTIVFRLSGLYAPRRHARLLDESFDLLKATVMSVMCLVGVFYFFRELRYSRLTIGLFAVYSFVGLATARAFARRLLRSLRRLGYNQKRVIIVGTGELAITLLDQLTNNPELGIHVVGVLRSPDDAIEKVGNCDVLGVYQQIRTVVREHSIDQVFMALPLDQHRAMVSAITDLGEEIVEIKVVPDLVQYYTLRGGAEDLFGLPIIHLQNGPSIGWDAVSKRIFDIVFSGLFVIAAGIPLLLVTIAVKLTSPGPVFYRQERMGLDGRVFQMLKFRSMRCDAEQTSGATWATKSDDRTTTLGKWLRKLSIDEMPQFINVLIGDMSLVGPRPERPVFIEQFKKQIPHYNLRHKVKAGITGLAQVEGWRGQTSLHKRIERDLYYIEHWSLWLDVKILIRTACGGFLSRNAY